ncbi:MAG: DUF502 domain-containing protein [Bdellovibrio sp.]|nr:DUF502 domain-containing protein [Bdellovibrio sp.]
MSLFYKCISFLKNHFLTGFFVVIPIAVIVWILGELLSFFWQFQALLPESFKPEAWALHPALVFLFNSLMVGLFAFLFIFIIACMGWISKMYLGQKVLEFISELIQHIPVLRSIYSALEQLLKAMTPSGSHQFNRVVYIEYPRKGIWALAFVTCQAVGYTLPKGYLNVFLPATPNPTSGFHLIVKEDEVIDSKMKVEEAFRTILSLGIAQPMPEEKTLTR